MTATAASDVSLRVPWWRHRRRLFWIAVILATIGVLSGAWVWWYRANFPMPPTEWLDRIGVAQRPVERWFSDCNNSLVSWKVKRETRLLRLEGSTWRNSGTGAQLSFGRDGILRVENSAEKPLFYHIFYPQRAAETEAALAVLDGTRYQFHRGLEVGLSTIKSAFNLSPEIDSSNLSFPDSPWQGYAYCLTDQEHILLVLSPRETATELKSVMGIFTRVSDR